MLLDTSTFPGFARPDFSAQYSLDFFTKCLQTTFHFLVKIQSFSITGKNRDPIPAEPVLVNLIQAACDVQADFAAWPNPGFLSYRNGTETSSFDPAAAGPLRSILCKIAQKTPYL